jgi:hypothetical protein
MTEIPVMGGTIKLIARVSDAELRQMYMTHQCPPHMQGSGERRVLSQLHRGNIQGDELGFRLSLRSLGRAVQSIAKPAALLKLTAMAARLAAGDPTALKLSAEVLLDVRRGMAARRVMRQAAAGNPRARVILARARAAASNRGALAPSTDGVDPGVMRYLVTVQRLAAAS